MWQPMSIAAALILILTPMAQAERTVVPSKVGAPTYDASLVCKSVHKGKKPVLDVIEDGLAYIPDIPLAMLSPLTCPVVAPLMERFDSDGSRPCPPCRGR